MCAHSIHPVMSCSNAAIVSASKPTHWVHCIIVQCVMCTYMSAHTHTYKHTQTQVHTHYIHTYMKWFEVLTAVFMKFQVFWDVTLRHWVLPLNILKDHSVILSKVHHSKKNSRVERWGMLYRCKTIRAKWVASQWWWKRYALVGVLV